MNHKSEIFYYPYASFTESQAPLLKAVALYFDKIYLLDLEKSSVGIIGMESFTQEVSLLESAGLLVRLAPEEILLQYEQPLAAAIATSATNAKSLQRCAASGKAKRCTTALAKIFKEIRDDPQFKPLDKAVQSLKELV